MPAVLLAAGLSLAACTSPTELPADAAADLHAYWETLPGSAAHDLEILRAWPGKTPPDSESVGLQEVWCVEALISPRPAGSGASETVIWISLKAENDSNWQSAPLMTMSSLWPYAACGVDR